ncbi:MAG: glycosyltransferase [Eubacterium sp.]|nr:glycosyltransferase [Eubacterium sp.]
MKIIFCGNMYDDVENDIKKMMHPNGNVAGHKFQFNLLKGFIENSDNVYVVNTSLIRYYPHYPEKIIKEKSFSVDGKTIGKSVGFLNLFGIHYFSRYISVKRELKKYAENNIDKEENCVIITYNSYLPIQLSVLNLKRRHKNICICNVVGDIFSSNGASWFKSYGFLKALILNSMSKFADKLSRKFDCFAFLTKDMACALKAENKPSVVVEGMYTINDRDKNTVVPPNANEKIIFYAGALREEYGIIHLLNAFKLIDNNDYRLYIAGSGDTETYIKECSEKDGRIKFLGFISPQEVEEQQRKAAVLVSPRISKNNEFVKYSFPSKTLECLASGTPYIAHRLPCDPPEYANYIQYADDESDEALAKKIIEICNMSESERKTIGEKARKFIKDEKNPAVMTKRIVEMLELYIENEGGNIHEN